MEKIKNILNPGHKVDDETLYGSGYHNSPAAKRAEGSGDAPLSGTHVREAEQPTAFDSTSPLAEKDTGNMRQIGNSNNDKYDATRFAPTASTTAPSGTHATEQASKDDSTMRQILNPQNDKHDHTRLGQSDASAVLGSSTHPISSTVGDSSRKPTSSAVPVSSSQPASSTIPQSTSSSNYGSATVFPTTTTGSTVRSADAGSANALGVDPNQSTQHYGRDAAVAGGAGAAGLGAYEASRHYDQKYDTTQSSNATGPIHQSTAHSLGPAAALGVGSGTGVGTSSSADTSYHIRPSGASVASNASIKSGVYGNAPTGSSLAKNSANDNLPSIPATGGKFMGGSSVNTSQIQSSGREFPLAGGQTTGATGATAGKNPASTSHTGRDAAIVGGTGLAGAGAYEAWKRHEQNNSASTSNQAQSTTTTGTAGGNHGREALAGAAAAAAPPGHEHGGLGHQYRGDPCPPSEAQSQSAFNGPHVTQTANRIDPKINHDDISHMPGSYPRTESDMVLPGSIQTSNINRPDNLVGSQGTTSDDRHLGRDAAVTSGAGAPGLGAYEASKHHENKPIVTTTNLQSISASSTMGSQGTTAGDHHLGRDVAVAGGAGVAGLGAYEASKHHDNTAGTTVQPQTVTGTSSGIGYGELNSREEADRNHHLGRDTAIAGSAGVTGIGLHEAAKHHEGKQIGSETKPSTTFASSMATGASGPVGTAPGRTFDSEDSKYEDQNHHGRDAAVAGGVGAAGLGAYEAKKHHDRKDDTPAGESTADENHHHKTRDAAAIGAAGAAGAGADHEYSKHEAEKLAKERQKEADKRHKEHEKDLKHQEKEAAKADKKHEKELEKGEKKSHGGFISKLLHRHKDKDTEEEDATESKHHREEATVGAGAVSAGVAAHEGRNKLHKDPPADHPASQLHEETTTGAGRQHIGTDGQIGDANRVSGIRQTRAGEYGAIDPEQEGKGFVTDPHTGLPVNVGKYGDVQGGTDGSSTIHGINQQSAGAQGAPGVGTDWEAIKQANTPY